MGGEEFSEKGTICLNYVLHMLYVLHKFARVVKSPLHPPSYGPGAVTDLLMLLSHTIKVHMVHRYQECHHVSLHYLPKCLRSTATAGLPFSDFT